MCGLLSCTIVSTHWSSIISFLSDYCLYLVLSFLFFLIFFLFLLFFQQFQSFIVHVQVPNPLVFALGGGWERSGFRFLYVVTKFSHTLFIEEAFIFPMHNLGPFSKNQANMVIWVYIVDENKRVWDVRVIRIHYLQI